MLRNIGTQQKIIKKKTGQIKMLFQTLIFYYNKIFYIFFKLNRLLCCQNDHV